MVISNSDITIDAGLKERRLFQLKKTVKKEEIIGIVAMQITDLIEFLGLDGKMSGAQILTTAEYIVDDFENFSLMALQHCFNAIKKSEPPFDESLYNSISGKKIIDWLRRYDKKVDDFLFAEAERKTIHDQMRVYDRNRTAGDKLMGMSGALGLLKNQVKEHGLSEAAKKYNNGNS